MSQRSREASLPRGLQVLRLKTRGQFQAVLAGETVARTVHFAMHRLEPNLSEQAPHTKSQGRSSPASFRQSPMWIGALVPKRWATRAVTRNLIKRQIYSVACHFEAVLPQAAHVVRLRRAFDRQQYQSAGSVPLRSAVRFELERLLSEAVADKKGAIR